MAARDEWVSSDGGRNTECAQFCLKISDSFALLTANKQDAGNKHDLQAHGDT